MANSSDDRRFWPVAAGAALARFIKLVDGTSRRSSNRANPGFDLRENHPCIAAMWHGQFMMVPTLNTQNVPVAIMVARHGDAQIIGEALLQFDMELIRGAGAGNRGRDRGGSQALRAAVRALAGGHSLAMTADVPPGPARQVGRGIITLARMSGRPILPVATASSRYLSLKTWSRFTINLPFSNLATVVGEPICVARDASTAEQERLRTRLEDALNKATAQAYRMAGANPARATPPSGAMAAAEGAAKSGLRVRGYERLTSLARPLAPMILKYRERRGKEDPARRPERLGQASVPRPGGAVAWIHGASVGELNAVLPLIDALAKSRADLSFVVTTGTLTSARLAAKRLGPRAIHQFVPLDAPEYVARFLDHWRPDLAIFAESEIWPNLILQSAQRQIPLALVNGRMSRKSFLKWRRNSAMAAALFGRFKIILAQNPKMSRRFSDLGAPHVEAAGNLKVDAPPPPIDDAALAQLRHDIGARPVFVAASTHAGEDEIIAEAHEILASSTRGLLTIIAPRHPERAGAIKTMLDARGLRSARRSAGETIDAATDIYLADTIGELGTLYALAGAVFIGGSLVRRGGQNPVEAVRHGAAVLTGPHWNNFRDEYKALIGAGAVGEVSSAGELARAAATLLADDAEIARRRLSAERTLEKLGGALVRTLKALAPLLPKGAEARTRKDLRRAS